MTSVVTPFHGKLCYIAAPFAMNESHTMLENVHRASQLCKHAVDHGYAPILVHHAVAAGAYGDDDDPAARARGLAVDVKIVEAVADVRGELWILRKLVGVYSSGVKIERDAFILRSCNKGHGDNRIREFAFQISPGGGESSALTDVRHYCASDHRG